VGDGREPLSSKEDLVSEAEGGKKEKVIQKCMEGRRKVESQRMGVCFSRVDAQNEVLLGEARFCRS